MVGPQFQADLGSLHLERHGEKSKWGLGECGQREKETRAPVQPGRNLLQPSWGGPKGAGSGQVPPASP